MVHSERTLELTDAAAVRAVFAGPIRALHSPRVAGGTVTSWRSAILKSQIHGPVVVGPLGLAGDAQKEKRHHGGPTKAVLVYGAEHYPQWSYTLGAHAAAHADALRTMSTDFDASHFGFGAFGENLTVSALSEERVCLGDIWCVGGCVLRITEPRGPCATLARRWLHPTLAADVRENAAAGWYNEVVESGPVCEGDALTLVSRMQDRWTVARVFHLLESRRVSASDVRDLMADPCCHEELRARLERRLSTPGRISND